MTASHQGSARGATAQQEAWLNQHHLDYHERQFRTLYRSTAHLIEFARRFISGRQRILDVACGACATMAHLGSALGGEWTGVDCNAAALAIARRLLPEYGMQGSPRLICGDMLHLAELLPGEAFDVVLSCQTLSWLPRYEDALASLLAMLKRPGGVAVITSLFSDFLVDARIEITEYPEGRFEAPRGSAFYNVYSLDRFRAVCLSAGAKEVVAQDFVMDVDLPVPDHRGMGTFTRTMLEGNRLQCSGPLLLPWKFVAVRM